MYDIVQYRSNLHSHANSEMPYPMIANGYNNMPHLDALMNQKLHPGHVSPPPALISSSVQSQAQQQAQQMQIARVNQIQPVLNNPYIDNSAYLEFLHMQQMQQQNMANAQAQAHARHAHAHQMYAQQVLNMQGMNRQQNQPQPQLRSIENGYHHGSHGLDPNSREFYICILCVYFCFVCKCISEHIKKRRSKKYNSSELMQNRQPKKKIITVYNDNNNNNAGKMTVIRKRPRGGTTH